MQVSLLEKFIELVAQRSLLGPMNRLQFFGYVREKFDLYVHPIYHQGEPPLECRSQFLKPVVKRLSNVLELLGLLA